MRAFETCSKCGYDEMEEINQEDMGDYIVAEYCCCACDNYETRLYKPVLVKTYVGSLENGSYMDRYECYKNFKREIGEEANY